jgi:hypothetical protein
MSKLIGGDVESRKDMPEKAYVVHSCQLLGSELSVTCRISQKNIAHVHPVILGIHDCDRAALRLNGARKLACIGNFTPYLHVLVGSMRHPMVSVKCHQYVYWYSELGRSFLYRCFTVLAVHENAHVFPSSDPDS